MRVLSPSAELLRRTLALMSIGRRTPGHGYFDEPGPLALAHRGFSLDGLENSMAAFAAAIDLGFRYVETDVHATADGVAVAFHDATLDRVTDRTGAVKALPWSEVRQAKIGGAEPVPALADVLGTWPDLRLNLDVKSVAAIGPLAGAIESTRAHHRVCVASFSDGRRRAIQRRLSAPVATSAGMSVTAAFQLASAARVTPAIRAGFRHVDCLQIPVSFRRVRLVTARTVAHAHAAGLQVHVWTVNNTDDMTWLLDLGVDGIITDRADLLREVLTERDVWPGR